VEIEMVDGTRHAHFQPYRVGDPEAPLDDAMLTDKFMELGGPVLGQDKAASLLVALWQLDARPVRQLGLGALRAR